ncbi:bis-aminopropyl spermidine synthase family protein [Lachnospiraceae bacterium 62-26]
MLSNILASRNIDKKLVELVDIVANSRPLANREYDQIYMFTVDMIIQAELMSDYIKNKKIVFVGDGDGMSMLFELLMQNSIIPSAQNMTVFDFDERILNNISDIVKRNNSIVPLNCIKYNIIDCVPKEQKRQFDFFYINPPYGSKNGGASCLAWLYRCMDLCCKKCSGCIVIPYDTEKNWTVKNMRNIQEFLIKHGFVIRDMISYMHRYHLDDNPTLKSATLIVDRVNYTTNEYSSEILPCSMIKNLYGKEKKLPRYILDDGSPYGLKDYDWVYGKDDFWL